MPLPSIHRASYTPILAILICGQILAAEPGGSPATVPRQRTTQEQLGEQAKQLYATCEKVEHAIEATHEPEKRKALARTLQESAVSLSETYPDLFRAWMWQAQCALVLDEEAEGKKAVQNMKELGAATSGNPQILSIIKLVDQHAWSAPKPDPTVIPALPKTEVIAPKNDPETTTTYVVKKGDTLGAIAGRYGVTITALKAANHIADVRKLSIGKELTIPKVSADPKAEPKEEPEAVPASGFFSLEQVFARTRYASLSRHARERLLLQAQEKMATAGVLREVPHGKMGPETENAILAWQHQHELVPTGRLDTATLASMGLERTGQLSVASSKHKH